MNIVSISKIYQNLQIGAVSLLIAAILQPSVGGADQAAEDLVNRPVKISDTTIYDIPNAEETVHDVFELYEMGREYISIRFDELGEKGFDQAVDQNKILFEHPKLGTAEATHIDNIPIVRVVYKKNHVAYLFVSAEQVQDDSEHFEKYIARQHLLSGYSRGDGKMGRDVVVVWLERDRVKNADLLARPRGYMERWKSFWKAHYKTPTFDDKAFGLTCGVLQAGLGLGMSCAQVWANADSDFWQDVSLLPAFFNFVFGAGIGVFHRTYKNIVFSTPSRAKQIMKASVPSLLYAYLIYASARGMNANLNVFDPAGFVNNLWIWLNVGLTQTLKVEMSQWAKILEEERTDLKEHVVKIPFSDKVMTITDRMINYQIKIQLSLMGIRMADLMGIGFSGLALSHALGIAVSENGEAAISKAFMLSLLPVVYIVTKWWANKYHSKAAKKMGFDRPVWDRPKQAITRFVKNLRSGKYVNDLQRLLAKDVEMAEEAVQKLKDGHRVHEHNKEVVELINLFEKKSVTSCRVLLRTPTSSASGE